MKSTQPPPADPSLEQFLADIREAGEYEARLAQLARLIAGQEEPPPSSGARRDSA